MPQSPKPDPDSRAQQFAALLADGQDQLFAYVRALVRDFNDADDLFQQTAIVLWRKFDSYDPQRSFLGWAMGIARFEVSNFLRTRSRSKLYFSDELNLLLADAQEDLSKDEADDRRDALKQCLGKLRERDRRLVEQCYGSDSTIVELGESIGRSSHSIHNSLRRIRSALFDCIRQTLMNGGNPGEEAAT
jgi:RNA polymerase sigma-70 factor (ECF subfamily)